MITLDELRVLARGEFPDAESGPVQLLVAWAKFDRGGELAALLDPAGMTTSGLRAALRPLEATFAGEDRTLLLACIAGSRDGCVTGEELLRSVARAPRHRVARALAAAGLDLNSLTRSPGSVRPRPLTVLVRQAIRLDPDATPLLEFGREVTALAAEGAFDDLHDRDEDVARVVQVLLRKEKRNLVLTGPPGVGKTGLVELLSRSLVRGATPRQLSGCRVFELSLGKLIAGTKYRGEFEDRVKRVLDALAACQPAILFVDECHLMAGAGRGEGAPMDLAGLLKPMLGRGELRVIAATTSEEYAVLARDGAIARRFQEIALGSPSPALLAKMISAQAAGLERHHGVAISPPIVHRAIQLTDLHVPDRWQPDKAVDLLDLASVAAVTAGRIEVTASDLMATLALQTGRPLSVLAEGDRESLRNLEVSLGRRVLGQSCALARVARVLAHRWQESSSGVVSLGKFLFAGDTGVGKTETARAISELLFRDADALLAIDLGGCSEAGSVNTLIGSPPGYVGSEQEGLIPRWLHRRSSGGTILFDEVDRAHAAIRELLLGMLDTGRFQSARGETLDIRGCVVVLTTNALKPREASRTGIGFVRNQQRTEPAELLAAHFPRELLSRLDEVILFEPLSETTLCDVMRLRLAQALAKLERDGVHLEFDESRLIAHLVAGLDREKTGARGVQRALERRLLQPVSTARLRGADERPLRLRLDGPYYEHGEVTR